MVDGRGMEVKLVRDKERRAIIRNQKKLPPAGDGRGLIWKSFDA